MGRIISWYAAGMQAKQRKSLFVAAKERLATTPPSSEQNQDGEELAVGSGTTGRSTAEKPGGFPLRLHMCGVLGPGATSP